MTDTDLFLQTYAKGVQIDEEIVLRFSSDSPIYRSAARYFDYLYELEGAEADQLSILETRNQKIVRHQVSSGLVVTREASDQRQVLLIPREDGFALPKGGVKAGEELIDAALRELFEETGLLLKLGQARYVGTQFVEQALHPELSMKVIIFHHRHLSNEEAALPTRGNWIDVSALLQLRFAYDYVRPALEQAGLLPRPTA